MSAKKRLRFIFFLSFVALISFLCSPKKPEFSPQQMAKFNHLSTEANVLFEKGSYVSLKKAFTIYQDQLAYPAFQNRTLIKLVRTALLLAIRENELSIIDEEDDLTRFLHQFPNSPLIQYKLSVFPKFDQKRMEALLQNDPEFYEAHFFLEEYDLSLEYNEKILALAPEYRDSLLGKAICLGYLGRHEEALDILDRLIQLGMYLMGESHYWMAWNLHELGQLESAWENVKRASNYLIGHSEVHSLAGIIAFDMSKVEASEEQFKKALWLNKGDCEASFYMGKIYSLRNEWVQSGIHFENAALCNAGMERALQQKIKELEESALFPSRKEKLIIKKKIQIRKVQVTKATAFYNAAAGYFNVGQNEKALELAQNAGDSKALKSKVEELINKIKEKIYQQGE